jgi:hypothetical protein
MRRFRRHLLDFDAAFGGGDNRDPTSAAIHEQREIKLARDVAAGFYINAMHAAPGRPGLTRDQRVADHRLGGGTHLVKGASDTYAAWAGRIIGEMAGATAAGMDLRFDNIDGPRQTLRRLHGRVRRPGDSAVEHGDAVFP